MSEENTTEQVEDTVQPKMIDMTKYRELTSEDIANFAKERARRAMQSWMDETIWWGYGAETTNTHWASEFVGQIEADLLANGFVLDRNHVNMTKRFLYWCWVMKNTYTATDATDEDVPFPCVSKFNSNDREEENVFYNKFGCHYWSKLEDMWKPEWMTLLMASYFFANLHTFFWRHVNTEQSPAIEKERKLLDALDEDVSGDERTGTDQGSYFKGKKELY